MKLKALLLGIGMTFTENVMSQTIDMGVLGEFSPSVQRATYAICAFTPVDTPRQMEIAQAIVAEDKRAVDMMNENGGFLSNKNKAELERMREDALSRILTHDQLEQYYRGVYNAEAQAEGVKMRDHVASVIPIGYQDGKFVNFCFYKIGLDRRVIAKLMKSTPSKAKEAIDAMTNEQLDILERKSGLRISPDCSKCERVRSVAIK